PTIRSWFGSWRRRVHWRSRRPIGAVSRKLSTTSPPGRSSGTKSTSTCPAGARVERLRPWSTPPRTRRRCSGEVRWSSGEAGDVDRGDPDRSADGRPFVEVGVVLFRPPQGVSIHDPSDDQERSIALYLGGSRRWLDEQGVVAASIGHPVAREPHLQAEGSESVHCITMLGLASSEPRGFEDHHDPRPPLLTR